MDPILTLLVGLAAGLTLGVLVGVLVVRARTTAGTDDSGLRERAAAAEATAAALADQVRLLMDEQKALQARSDADNRVLKELAPVQETLRQMGAKVAEMEKERATQFGALNEQLTSSRRAGDDLMMVTQGLTSALSNNSARGMWGEVQLRRLVEVAGLLEHVDFVEQETVRSDAGAGRIDLVVRLSDGKSLAIDAKVPLASYLEASKIPITAVGTDGERRERLMSEHAKAVRAHVDQLAKREYWLKLDTSPDLVVCFIPSEALLASALESDPTLLDYAFGKNVALASPVTLWSVLKTIGYSWRQDSLSKDAKRIFDLARELYSRVRTLSEHAEALRRSIEGTVSNYNKFAATLETRVLVTARKINENGDPSLEIDEAQGIDTSARQLSAPETIQDELASLDQTGVGRPQLDITLIDLPAAKPGADKTA
jgi:DNA recombination protein RmuC